MRSRKQPTFIHRPRGRGRRSDGSRGGQRHGGVRAGPECVTGSKPIYEEGDKSGVEESWPQGDWVFSDDGAEPSHTTGDAAGPSHTMSYGASQEYKAPQQSPRMLPPVFSGSAHDVNAYLSPH
nr:hypothetical protein CFP56_28115 [Quercus suber]